MLRLLAPARQKGGHAGSYRPLPDDELAFARDERRRPDLDTCHIGDGVVLTRISCKRKLQRPGAGLAGWGDMVRIHVSPRICFAKPRGFAHTEAVKQDQGV